MLRRMIAIDRRAPSSPSSPSSPQDDAAHERMHHTLKRQAIEPVRQTCAALQRNFDAFRREYNIKRPHEALVQTTLASRCTRSFRPCPTRVPTPECPRPLPHRSDHDGGHIPLRQAARVRRNALTNQRIGIEETDDGRWSSYFDSVGLVTLDERDHIIQS